MHKALPESIQDLDEEKSRPEGIMVSVRPHPQAHWQGRKQQLLEVSRLVPWRGFTRGEACGHRLRQTKSLGSLQGARPREGGVWREDVSQHLGVGAEPRSQRSRNAERRK